MPPLYQEAAPSTESKEALISPPGKSQITNQIRGNFAGFPAYWADSPVVLSAIDTVVEDSERSLAILASNGCNDSGGKDMAK